MAKNKQVTLKIVAATSVTIFSLLTLFVGTFAWFSMRGSANINSNDGMRIENTTKSFQRMEIYGGEYVLNNEDSKYYYRFDNTADTVITLSYDGSLIGNFTMGQYSSLNRHHPIMIVLSYENSMDAIDVSATTPTTYYVGDVANHGLDQYVERDHSKKPLSSFIHTYATGYAESLPATRNVSGTDYYYYEDSVMEGYATNGGSFVTFSNGAFTYNTTCNFAHFTDVSYKKIVIFIDYYQDSIEYICSAYLKDLTGTINMACDWTITL